MDIISNGLDILAYMVDVFTPQKRSEVMSRIKGRNTRLEASGFSLLREVGLRFRRYPKGIFGHPDAANKKKKIAIFIDSDFWHGYNYQIGKFHKNLPNEYWHKKIRTNIYRDKSVNAKLTNEGWVVIRIWEHELEAHERKKTLNRVLNFLKTHNIVLAT